MKTSIIKFGLFSFVTASLLFLASLMLGKEMSLGNQELIGYASMFISLLFVFFGIRHFRDHENAGKVSFGKALLIGISISLFAAIGFAIIDYIYTSIINPDWAANYETEMLTNLKDSLSAEEFEIQRTALQEQMQTYGGSGFMALMMFSMVLILGIIISLVSSLILQRK